MSSEYPPNYFGCFVLVILGIAFMFPSIATDTPHTEFKIKIVPYNTTSAVLWFVLDDSPSLVTVKTTTTRMAHASVIAADGSILLIGGYDLDCYNDTWRSIDGGKTWTQINASGGWSARQGMPVVVLPNGNIILAGGLDSKGMLLNDVWRSTDNGYTWEQINSSAGWTARYFQTMNVMPDGDLVLMGGAITGGSPATNDTWRSTNGGFTWKQVNASSGWNKRYYHTSTVTRDGKIVLGAGFVGVSPPNNYDFNDTWMSADEGSTWTQMTAAAPWISREGSSLVTMPDNSIVIIGGLHINGYGDPVIREMDDIWRSTDNGATWLQSNTTLIEGVSSQTDVVTSDGTIIQIGGSLSNTDGFNFPVSSLAYAIHIK